jgi:hypothetical protein
VPVNIVTDAEVAKQPEGSPRRALFSWWQAVQFGDVDGALDLTDRSRLTDEPAFVRAIRTAGDQLPNVRVVSERKADLRASVRVFLEFFDSADRKAPQTLQPRTFNLRLVGNDWKVADTSYALTVAKDTWRRKRAATASSGR